jgi:hypothetical protein
VGVGGEETHIKQMSKQESLLTLQIWMNKVEKSLSIGYGWIPKNGEDL